MTDDPDRYTCANCGGNFEQGQSDEAARAEYEKTFPGMGDEAPAVVCDDCFKLITDWAKKEGFDIRLPEHILPAHWATELLKAWEIDDDTD